MKLLFSIFELILGNGIVSGIIFFGTGAFLFYLSLKRRNQHCDVEIYALFFGMSILLMPLGALLVFFGVTR